MDDNKMIEAFSPLEINQTGGNRVEIFKGIPPAFNCYKPSGFGQLHATGGFGNMSFQHFSGAGFDIWYSHYGILDPSTFVARGNFPALELHIPFNTHAISWWDGGKDNILSDKQFDLSYYPFINSRTHFAGGHQYSSFDIHYSPAYLRKYSEHSPSLADFLEKV